MSTALGYIWGAMIVAGWVYLTIEYIRTAIRGRFPHWRRKANGKTWPPVRSEAPVRFWMAWCLMAVPFLFITAISVAVLVGTVWQNLP